MVKTIIENKKIIVTGGQGFLGSHVVEYLIKERGLSKESIFIPRKKDYDLRKESNVKKLFKDFKAEIVIHLATTVGGIGYNKQHPGTLYYENLLMNSYMLEIAKQNKIEKFLAVGTALAYPNSAEIPLKENSIWEGYPEETLAPIGIASKIMLVQSHAYRKEFGFNSIYVIPANLYGPGDHFSEEHSHVVPATIKKFYNAVNNKEDKVEIWGTGKASREFLHVKDAARGLILALSEYDSAEPLNLGSGEEITIKEIVESIKKISGFKGQIVWDPTKPEGQLRRCLDSTRVKNLGFYPKIKFEEGIRDMLRWYMENKENIKH